MGWALMPLMIASAGMEFLSFSGFESLQAFWATAPLAQHVTAKQDTAKQDQLLLNFDHVLDSTGYWLLAFVDQRYETLLCHFTKIRV